jgi:HSP20 family protein
LFAAVEARRGSSLHNGMLTIAAERREGDGAGAKQGQGQQQRSGEHEPTYLLRERRQQRLVRSFSLPPSADESKIEAKLENVVLRLTVEKRPETRAKRISVT